MARVVLALVLVVASAELQLDKFSAWAFKHSKTYGIANERQAARAAFIANDEIIEATNSKGLSYWLGHNQFSDLTWEQFKAKYVGKFNENPTLNRDRNYDMTLLNTTVTGDVLDWSTKGAVTPVKNQAQCGSCWAFSTTGSLEGAYQISGMPLTSLSEQDLVSCENAAHGGSDQGCDGGLMDNAFKWVMKNGISTEASYPYTSGGGSSGTCKTTRAPVITLTGHTDVPGESGLMAAITKGPVSVAIEADRSAFQLYKGGVVDDASCGTQLDHGVLAIGYGTDAASSKDYYKVKNSWAASWYAPWL
jgi:C1A family cysteine protease